MGTSFSCSWARSEAISVWYCWMSACGSSTTSLRVAVSRTALSPVAKLSVELVSEMLREEEGRAQSQGVLSEGGRGARHEDETYAWADGFIVQMTLTFESPDSEGCSMRVSFELR